MTSIDCKICFNRFDGTMHTPKNLPCGHVFCLHCLRSANRARICFTCQQTFNESPESLRTNYSILSDASDTSLIQEFFCLDCKMGASLRCQNEGHHLKSYSAHRAQQTEGSRKSAQASSKVLEDILPHLLHMRDVVEAQINLITVSQDSATALLARLSSLTSNGAGKESLLEAAQREATGLALQLDIQKQGLQMLQLEKGSCQLQVQTDQGLWTANQDLSTLAAQEGEILMANKFLFYILTQHKYLQCKQSDRYRGTANGHGKPPLVDPNNSQVLDLSANGVGEAPEGSMTSEKARLVSSTMRVVELKGLHCDKDPRFSCSIIQKFAPYLETVALHKIQQEHFNLLGSMHNLKHLKIVGNSGRLAARLPRQTMSQLQSMYLSLPVTVELALWEAYGDSVRNLTLRVEVESCVEFHRSIRKAVQASSNLRTLQLHRKCVDQHNPFNCGRQLDEVRSVLPADVRLSCNMCKGAGT